MDLAAVGCEFEDGLQQSCVADPVVQHREVIRVPVEEEDNIVSLFQGDEFLFLAKDIPHHQSFLQKRDLLLFLGPIDEDRFVPKITLLCT